MKKVAIITINSLNYGNRLQNYALQRVVETLGMSAETVKRGNYIWDNDKTFGRLDNFIRCFFGTKKGLFISFDIKHMKYSEFFAGPDDVDKSIVDEYDYFITGSDQVWNPYYHHLVGDCDLLSFAPPEKRISYAASFGVDLIPDDQTDKYIKALSDYRAISVREESGVSIVEKLIHKTPTLVLDPTLLLERNEWERIAKKPRGFSKGNFLLLYTLGQCSANAMNDATRLAREKSLIVVDIMKKTKGRNPSVGPAEFIWLIQNAKMVITNSFHATVFSYIFRTPVRTYPRGGIDISSRIVSLAKTLGYIDRFDDAGVLYLDGTEDRKTADHLLGLNRSESIRFLTEALKE